MQTYSTYHTNTVISWLCRRFVGLCWTMLDIMASVSRTVRAGELSPTIYATANLCIPDLLSFQHHPKFIKTNHAIIMEISFCDHAINSLIIQLVAQNALQILS